MAAEGGRIDLVFLGPSSRPLDPLLYSQGSFHELSESCKYQKHPSVNWTNSEKLKYVCIFQKPENLGSGRFDHDWLWYEINLGKQYYVNEISFLPTSDCNNNDYNNNCSKLYNFIKLKKTSLNEIDLKPLIKRKNHFTFIGLVIFTYEKIFLAKSY